MSRSGVQQLMEIMAQNGNKDPNLYKRLPAVEPAMPAF